MSISQQKIDAIFELREAAERKALAHKAVVEDPSPQTRDELLDAQLQLESKTATAIDVCHECGHSHEASQPHGDRSP